MELSTVNTQEIATRVKTQFGDTDGSQITDAGILMWINDAQREIVLDAELMQRRATTNIVASQADYLMGTLFTTLLRTLGVKYKDTGGVSRKLVPISLREAMDQFEGVDNSPALTGVPTHYSVWNNTITLYPSPVTAVTGGLIIYYVATPTPLTAISATNVLGTDLPDLPVEYHNRIVEYCIAQAAELDDNLPLAQTKMGQFSEGITKLKDYSERPVQDMYPNITYTGDSEYFYYG